MALTYAIQQKLGAGAARMNVVRITIGAAGDYSAGLTFDAASCGVAAIQHVIHVGGNAIGNNWFWDHATSKLRANKTGSALSGELIEVAGSDVSGDVIQVLVIGDQVNKG